MQSVDQIDRPQVSSGDIFDLLTQRPDNCVPLTWERNYILILLEEGATFTCAWSHRPTQRGDDYDLDHLVPVSVYPMNELWNLVLTHPSANNRKRDRMPTRSLLEMVVGPLVDTYQHYLGHHELKPVLLKDTQMKFSRLDTRSQGFNQSLARHVIQFMDQVAESRSLPRVEGF